MTCRQAICIAIDGLRASGLGAYGNTISPTPRLDKLASRSTVVEWLWADSPVLAEFYRSVWEGTHTLRRELAGYSMLAQFSDAGIERRLITDDSELAEQPCGDRFDSVVCVETAADFLAEDISDTATGQFCSAVLERLQHWLSDSSDGLTWLHSRGMYGPWDAPVDLRAEQLDDEDPPPAEFLVPPAALVGVDDPDVLLVHRAAYAAQVAVVDACVGALCQAIEELCAGTETLLVVLGTRGFALGEHGDIGTECGALFGERLHLPCILHVCGNKIPQPRASGLVQPADMGAALLRWFGIAEGNSLIGGGTSGRVAVSKGVGDERSIRTPAWYLREPAPEQPPQLFVKPDDRWEANDVAVRCPEVVEGLHVALNKFKAGTRVGAIELDDSLVNIMR